MPAGVFRLIASLIVLVCCYVTMAEVRAERVSDCDTGEAGNLLMQAADHDPAFRVLAERLMRLGYLAESTCIVGRVREGGADSEHFVYSIEQKLNARTIHATGPAVLPPYSVRTRISFDARLKSATIVEFTVARRLTTGD